MTLVMYKTLDNVRIVGIKLEREHLSLGALLKNQPCALDDMSSLVMIAFP